VVYGFLKREARCDEHLAFLLFFSGKRTKKTESKKGDTAERVSENKGGWI